MVQRATPETEGLFPTTYYHIFFCLRPSGEDTLGIYSGKDAGAFVCRAPLPKVRAREGAV